MYTNVVIEDEKPLGEYAGHHGWQTKDVVRPAMNTIIITRGGRLIYERQVYEVVENDNSVFGFSLQHVYTSLEEIKFSGMMYFYDFYPNLDSGTFVEFCAEFNDGKLVSIKQST